MTILVTGGSGFLGTALIPRLLKQGHKVYSISRHPPEIIEGVTALKGDILNTADFGLREILAPLDIKSVYHLAAIHKLSKDKDGSIWETNVNGTKNVIRFCITHEIPHLYFCSTAYTRGRNPYEWSKSRCEIMVRGSVIPKITIFKPSIIMGTEEHYYPGHFSQFVSLLIRIHQRAEAIRRKVEGTMRLPIIEPVFRLKGNPLGKLNMLQIDQVADAMTSIKEAGTFWLTHPSPPSLQELVEWVGEYIMVDLRISLTFKATPLEATMQKVTAAFEPYLQGDDFPSDLKDCPPITREFIHNTISQTLKG